MAKSKQYRKVCGITYIPADLLLEFFVSKNNIIRNFSFITHDRDIYLPTDKNVTEDKIGSLKPIHTHFIILLKYPYPISTIQNWFRGFYDDSNVPINTFVEPCTDINSYFRYFLHLDNPEKVQYNDNEIISGDVSEFQLEDTSCEDTAFIILDLMLQGVSTYEIAKRYGRDFIYHFGHIHQVYNQIIKEENENV